MPRVLGGSWGDGRFLMSEVPLYLAYKKPPPRRTLSRPMPRVLGGSWGDERFLMSEVPLYLAHKKQPPSRTLR
jgi:hypothetical protein